jgi:sec-independent protein translocase protein TatA
MMLPLITAPGVPELLLILLVLVLLFGAKKLPELARGSGRALRIFKAETKGLMDDDDDDDATKKSPEQLEIDAAAAREALARRSRLEQNGPTAV